MVKNNKCYAIKYYDNIFDKNETTWKMSRTEASKKVKKMKSENAKYRHNSKVISGKPFYQFKKIRIVKVC